MRHNVIEAPPEGLASEIIPLGPSEDEHLTIAQLHHHEGFEFYLVGHEYALVKFSRKELFGTRWALLHEGSNEIIFANKHAHASCQVFVETDEGFTQVTETRRSVPLPPAD